MKVEISEDQNTLTVDGVEYEAKLNDVWPHKPSCKSCAFYDNGFCKIGLETPLGVNASDLRRCEYPYRNDGKSIYWVKKEVEQDDKKAIVIFSDNEKVLTISGHSEHDGTYEAKENFGCDGCFFENRKYKNNCNCTFDTTLSNQKCTFFRQDKNSIIWIKQEAEQMTEAPMPFPALAPAPFLMPAPAPVPHVHAEIITEWVKNINQPVFAFFEGEWTELGFSNPSWDEDLVYALGDKPTSPPMKKLKVKIKLDRNEFEIEVPYDARIQEIDKAIMDMATQFMAVTQEII